VVKRNIYAHLKTVDQSTPTIKKVSLAFAAMGAAAAAAAVLAAKKIGTELVGAMKAAVNAAAVQQDAEMQLAQAIRLTGDSVDSVLPALKDMASGLQDITGVGDEVILKGQALLVTMGKLKGEGLERATKAALDMAAVTGNVETAFDLVAKAATGYTSTLSRYGIILDKGIPEQEKFNAALGKMEEIFGGQAEARLNTFNGRLEEFHGRIGDLQEAIGEDLRDAMQELLGTVLSPTVKELEAGVRSADAFTDAVFDATIGVAKFGEVTFDLLSEIQLRRESLGKYLQFFIAMTPAARSATKSLAQSLELIRIAFHKTNVETSETDNALSRIADRFGEAAANLESAKITKAFKKAIGAAAAGVPAIMRDAVGLKPFVLPVKLGLAADDKEGPRALLESITPALEPIIEAAGSMEEGFTNAFAPIALLADEQLPAVEFYMVRLEEAMWRFIDVGGKRLAEEMHASGEQLETLGDTVSRTFRGEALNAVGTFSDTLVSAAFGADIAWGEVFRSMLAQLTAMILKALAFRAIMGLLSFGGGAAAPEAIGAIPFGGTSFGLIRKGGLNTPIAPPIVTPGPATDIPLSAFESPTGGPTIQINAAGAVFLDERVPPRLARQLERIVRGARVGGVSRGGR